MTSAFRGRSPFLVGAAIFFCVFTLLEIAARVVEYFRPPWAIDFGLGFDAQSRLFLPHGSSGFVVTNPTKKPAFLEQRFRAVPPPNTFRIVALGGSSVNYLQPELHELARRLEKLPSRYERVEIINAGGLSYGTHRLLIIAAELLQYRPNALLLYSGHNEFEDLEQLSIAEQPSVRMIEIMSRSAFFRLFRDAMLALHIYRIQAIHRGQELIASDGSPAFTGGWGRQYTKAEALERAISFERNLSWIVRSYREWNIPVVIGTVASNLWRPALSKNERHIFQPVRALLETGHYEEASALAKKLLPELHERHQASSVENAIIRRLATQHHVLLADVERAVERYEPHGVPGETLFSDHCHLNAEGNRVLIETYEEALASIITGRQVSASPPRSSSRVPTD